MNFPSFLPSLVTTEQWSLSKIHQILDRAGYLSCAVLLGLPVFLNIDGQCWGFKRKHSVKNEKARQIFSLSRFLDVSTVRSSHSHATVLYCTAWVNNSPFIYFFLVYRNRNRSYEYTSKFWNHNRSLSKENSGIVFNQILMWFFYLPLLDSDNVLFSSGQVREG